MKRDVGIVADTVPDRIIEPHSGLDRIIFGFSRNTVRKMDDLWVVAVQNGRRSEVFFRQWLQASRMT